VGPEEGHKNHQRDRAPLPGGKAGELGFFSMEKRKLWEKLIAAF